MVKIINFIRIFVNNNGAAIFDKVVATNTSYYCEQNKSQYEKWKYFNDGIALTRIVFGIVKMSNQRNKYNQKTIPN